MDAEFEPPGTWEEVAALSRTEKIKAAQVFLRRAAIRLHEDAQMAIDEVYNAFESIPPWISSQKHAWKQANAPGVRYKCENCDHVDLKSKFFTDEKNPWLPICPKCTASNASRVEPQIVGSKKVSPQLKLDPGEPCRVCAGLPCPVCEIGTMEEHRCTHCNTLLCGRCHGIRETECTKAYDTIKRCRCEEKM